MVGMTDGQQVLVGNRRLMERYNVQGYPTEPAEYGTEVLVAEGNVYLGRIIIADEARPDSAEAIADLNSQDIKTVMLTGDAEASANYIAKETGVSAVRAQLLPQDKLSVVQDIRSEYGPTMFVGDGINVLQYLQVLMLVARWVVVLMRLSKRQTLYSCVRP